MKTIKTSADDCCATPGLMSVDDAIEKILSSAVALEESETIDIIDGLNRVLADDVHSTIDVPGYDNSAMDGYAVNSLDCETSGATLSVTQRIPAGQVGGRLERGNAARIFTGAPVPEGADAVVMQERCELKGDEVVINESVSANNNVRFAGEDIAKDSVILKSGTRLRAQELGLLASVGLAELKVKRKLKVATFFTGDEIVSPGQPLASGQIYNSNRYTIRGLLQAMDCEIVDLGIVPDTLEATLDVLKQASVSADLVITSGGVSVGEEDYVRIALEKLGELSMWRIAMKPGKPVAFGKIGSTLFMGLPGNPVSTFITAQIFAYPLVRKMQGESVWQPLSVTVKADFEWGAVKRQEYLRARISMQDNDAMATIFPKQGSGVLSSACWSDGMVVVHIDEPVKKGDRVLFIPYLG